MTYIIKAYDWRTNSKDCNFVYQGMEPRYQDYYDMCNGGWKVEYFKNNIYDINKN